MRPLSEAAVALLWLLAATTASAQAGDEGSQPTHAHTGSAAPGANPTPTAPQSTTASPSPTTDGAESPATDDAGAAEDDEDEGDPYDFLWVELFGGWSWVDLRALSSTNFYPEFVRLRGDGPAGGLAAGFRIEFLSVGIRGSLAHYGDDFDLGTLTAEAQLSLPLPVVKPYIRLGGGLGWHGDSDFDAPMMSQTTVFGWAFAAAAGLDLYFVDWLAVGAALNVDVLSMSRRSLDEPVSEPGDVRFEEPGDAVGVQVRGQVAVSIHL